MPDAPASSASHPLVSCLMVTANRPHLLRRSVRCFNRQTYPNRKLIVLDDGEVDLSEHLAEVPGDQLRYERIPKVEGQTLGALRNQTLELAEGAYVAQWDDDDWYHEDRLRLQIAELENGHDACTLDASLMHLSTPAFVRYPYVGVLKGGVPGSIVHRRDEGIRYPAQRRAEDTVYREAWRARRYTTLGRAYAYLFIRSFHGSNTWEAEHFLRRVRNSPHALLAYAWHAGVRRDVTGHPRFRLSPQMQDAFEQYLADSAELGLLRTIEDGA